VLDGGYRYWFYMSYAHANLDRYLEKYHADLAKEVQLRLGADDAKVGFWDTGRIEVGSDWSAATSEALATARTLVPIISPHFIQSEYCGKEWQLFLKRFPLESPRSAILPVLWMPIPRDLPSAIARVQLWTDDFPQVYREEGLRFVMRLSRYADDYRKVVSRFAQRLIEAASDELAPPLQMVPPFDALPMLSPARTPGRRQRWFASS
jgi:hypothetical protein